MERDIPIYENDIFHACRSKFQSKKSKIFFDVSPQLSRKAGTVQLGKLLERCVKEFEAKFNQVGDNNYRLPLSNKVKKNHPSTNRQKSKCAAG
jgi:hypothetical protein